jgi:hypothetical protein
MGAEQLLAAAGHGDPAVHEAVDAIVRAADATVEAHRGPELRTSPPAEPVSEALPEPEPPEEAATVEDVVEEPEPPGSTEDEHPRPA